MVSESGATPSRCSDSPRKAQHATAKAMQNLIAVGLWTKNLKVFDRQPVGSSRMLKELASWFTGDGHGALSYGCQLTPLTYPNNVNAKRSATCSTHNAAYSAPCPLSAGHTCNALKIVEVCTKERAPVELPEEQVVLMLFS